MQGRRYLASSHPTVQQCQTNCVSISDTCFLTLTDRERSWGVSAPSHPAHFIWLVPTEGFPDSEALSAFTKRLQEQTKTPRFMPHVTLYKALPSELVDTPLRQRPAGWL